MSAESLPLEAIERSPVSNFFNGKKVLITGATGFVGKVLVCFLSPFSLSGFKD